MIPLLSDNLNAITQICEVSGVRKLEVFGSAARGDFDPATSDFDFIVDFLDYGPGVADRYFALSNALEALLGRPVEFVFARRITSPYLQQSIAESRQILYEARDREIAA